MFKSYCSDPISIVRAPDPPFDVWNEPIAPTVEATKGYVVWKTALVMNLEGDDVLSRGHVIMTYDRTLNHVDKIRIGTKNYLILAIKPLKDTANVGLKVFLQ